MSAPLTKDNVVIILKVAKLPIILATISTMMMVALHDVLDEESVFVGAWITFRRYRSGNFKSKET